MPTLATLNLDIKTKFRFDLVFVIHRIKLLIDTHLIIQMNYGPVHLAQWILIDHSCRTRRTRNYIKMVHAASLFVTIHWVAW
jgi:hypothetical protein